MGSTGPLNGVRVLELAGIGPGPFAAMVLSDLGAEVVRVDRVSAAGQGPDNPWPPDLLSRGRRSLAVDLKHPDGIDVVLRLVGSADVLIEGFRPGVTERLGLAPDVCLARNPRLVYGRVTGWGQDGTYASMAGHDINYIALAGALEPIGHAEGPPVPPLNLLGDFGGGGMLLALGIACALVERASSDQGQVIDAAMVDGAALLTTLFHGIPMGPRGTNLLDSGAPHYNVYECLDGTYVSIGSIEPQFYTLLRQLLALDDPEWDSQNDADAWPARKEKLAQLFRTRTRAEWCELFEGTDVCFAPVLSMDEAHEHPHNKTRGTFVTVDGVTQPAPAPRFSRTSGAIAGPPVAAGAHTDDVLVEAGFDPKEISRLRRSRAIG